MTPKEEFPGSVGSNGNSLCFLHALRELFCKEELSRLSSFLFPLLPPFLLPSCLPSSPSFFLSMDSRCLLYSWGSNPVLCLFPCLKYSSFGHCTCSHMSSSGLVTCTHLSFKATPKFLRPQDIPGSFFPCVFPCACLSSVSPLQWILGLNLFLFFKKNH